MGERQREEHVCVRFLNSTLVFQKVVHQKMIRFFSGSVSDKCVHDPSLWPLTAAYRVTQNSTKKVIEKWLMGDQYCGQGEYRCFHDASAPPCKHAIPHQCLRDRSRNKHWVCRNCTTTARLFHQDKNIHPMCQRELLWMS